MIDDLGPLLEPLANDETARRTARHTTCLRGIRGVPAGEVARVLAELYRAGPPDVPHDLDALTRIFGAAWEDGLVAIGLAAATVSDAPGETLEHALDWAERTDDVATADALGWLVLAPAALLTSRDREALGRLSGHARPETRRVALAMAMGFTPAPVEGPAAAALREKVGERHVRLVGEPLSDRIAPFASRFVRDQAPVVQKALRRLLRAWGEHDPDAVLAWADSVRGGLPRLLGDEVRRLKSRRR
jgi:hypothetical protein